MKAKIAVLANYSAAILLLIMGIIYLTKTSFMSYHSDAISLEWSEVDKDIKFLILALMRGVSAGLIAGSFTIFFLQSKFMTCKLTWIPVLILIVGIILSGVIIYSMYTVKVNTPGNPPIVLTISGIAILLIGFITNLKTIPKR